MSRKAVISVVLAIFLALLLTACVGGDGSGSTESLCPRACRDADLEFGSGTATTCDCLRADGSVVKLW